MQYSIFYEPDKEVELLLQAEFLNLDNAELVDNDPLWPSGYMVFEQDLSGTEWITLDDLANEHVLINIYPSPRPPYSPTGR